MPDFQKSFLQSSDKRPFYTKLKYKYCQTSHKPYIDDGNYAITLCHSRIRIH